MVREHIQRQLVDDNLKDRQSRIIQRAFIEAPEHFLIRDRWLSQTDPVLLRMKTRQDKRLKHWAATGFYHFCANRGHGERFVNCCQWVREVFSHDQATAAMALGHQALVLEGWGQLDEAMVLHQKEEAIYEALGDRAGLSLTYWNQGCLQAALGKPQAQKQLWLKSIAFKKAIGMPTEEYEKALAALE